MNLGFLKKGKGTKKINETKKCGLIKKGRNKPKFFEIQHSQIQEKMEVLNSVIEEFDYEWHPNEGF